MIRHLRLLGATMVAALVALSGLAGCRPQQPFHFLNDGDLSHYIDVATQIEYPNYDQERLGEVNGAGRPLSLDNSDPKEIWALTLEEAVRYALENSKVFRSLGGRLQPVPQGIDTRMPNQLVPGADRTPTVYDPATTEANPRFGTEAALSAFDTEFTTNVFWERNNEPRNPLVFFGSQDIFPRISKEDVGNFQAQLRKTAATGGTWVLRHNVAYSQQNTSRLFPSDWNVNLQAEFRQPLLQGAGVEFNRIANPGAIPGYNAGIMLARVNSDIALADFESAVQSLVADVEGAYWELYFAYRALDAAVAGRDANLQTWRQIKVEFVVGTGAAHEEAQARQQYFLFKSAMERAVTAVYEAEANLRYIMGLASSDGRLIRPATEPTIAKVLIAWSEAQNEALCRNVELRRQKWNIKRRELELVSAKNYLLPRLDAVGRYTWLGLGDDLLHGHQRTGNSFDNAYSNLTEGDFQDWHLGVEASIPIGFRKELAGVRYAQLNLAREQAVLQEQELELSHQLAYAIREMESSLILAQTNFNRRIAAKDELTAAKAKYEAGVAEGTLDRVLDAQRRLSEAESDFYRAVVNYNKSIANIHFVKGSLLEYNGICLAEGPWPGKAYFDARRIARARDSSFYLDYGFTRPGVVSRGPYQQHSGRGAAGPGGDLFAPSEAADGEPEQVPTPAPEPTNATEESAKPTQAEPTLSEPSLFEPSPLEAAPSKVTEPGQSVPGEPPAPSPATQSRAKAQPGRPVFPDKLLGAKADWSVARKTRDLGSLNLGSLAGKPAGAPATDASAGEASGVIATSHEEPIAPAFTAPADAPDKPSDNGWKASR